MNDVSTIDRVIPTCRTLGSAMRAPLTVVTLLLTVLAIAPSSGGASLILATPDETSGTGLGAVFTVLTIQDDPDESGCVAWSGSADVVGPSACPPGFDGGDEIAINETRTLSELGLSSAFNLRVIFNYNEDNTDDITLEDLNLRIYSPTGVVLFDSGPFTPVTFPEPFSGTGTAGFVFRLDTEQAAEANVHFGNPDNRIGLAATASQSSAGPETFYVGRASAILPAAADLAVTKTDDPDPVAPGDPLTYTLVVDNDGPNRATGVTVTDTVPASVTIDQVTPSQGSCSTAGRVVTCDLGEIASGGSAQVTVTVTTGSTDGSITNTASVSGDQSDPQPGNNTATENTTVGTGAANDVDLELTKTDSPDPAEVGQPLTYTLTVTNTGSQTATGVTLTDTLPASVTFVSASTNDGTCTQSGRTVSCDLDPLGSTDSATVTIVVTPQQEGQITNTANVSANEPDTDSTDNGATEETQVGAGPVGSADLVLVKNDQPDPLPAGSLLTYTLGVTNVGPNAATNVALSDTLPASADFVSAAASQGSCAETGGVVTCELGTLADGASASVEIRVRPTVEGQILNTAAVSAEQDDPSPADNTATEETTVTAPVPSIPTAGSWALIGLGLLLALVAVRRLGGLG